MRKTIIVRVFIPVLALSIWALITSWPIAALSQPSDPSADALAARTLRLIEAEKLDPSDAARILVAPGCEGDKPGECPESARDYYTKVIDPKLVRLSSLTSTLDTFVSYFGYHGLRAVDLEILDSDVLMPHDQASFDALRAKVSSPTDFAANPNLTLATFKSGALLSARFFAPKIVDYNAAPAAPGSGQDPHVAGWRKLIRLLALPNSDAYKKGGAQRRRIFCSTTLNRTPA
jgi:hypothetical protein